MESRKNQPTIVLGTIVTPPFPKLSLQGRELAAHKLITGITGQGKSSFIASLVVQLLNQGIAVAVIDPHGDLCDTILEVLLASGFFSDTRAYQRLWYIDFSSQDAYIPFNVLNQPYETHATAAHTLEAFKRAWPELTEGAANLENILLASLLVLIENNLPITALQRLISDAEFRDQLLQNIKDELVIDFFQRRFAGYGRQASSLSESTLRRVFILTFSPILRGCLGSRENKLHFRSLMDRNISCLFNLGNLDQQTQRLLGCLISVGYEEAALSRSDIPNLKRTPMHLFIDEFAQFAAHSEEAMEHLLTQARKFGLSLNLSCQTMAQAKRLHGALQNALHISFQMGYEDAITVAPKLVDDDEARMYEAGASSFLAEKVRPGVYSDAEIKGAWLKLLKSLRQREALVAIGYETRKIQTLGVHTNPETASMLHSIKERYKTQLLTAKSSLGHQKSVETKLAAQLSKAQEEQASIQISSKSRIVDIDEF
jgi:hypothetical protein